jgi:hypothetical protein
MGSHSITCTRQHFADQREVRPEAIALPPVSRALDGRGLPAARVNVDAVPLPALRERVATGLMVGRLVEMSVDRERDIFLEVEADRWQLRVFRGEDHHQISSASDVMPD